MNTFFLINVLLGRKAEIWESRGKGGGGGEDLFLLSTISYICIVFHLRLQVLVIVRALQLHDIPVRQVKVVRINLQL